MFVDIFNTEKKYKVIYADPPWSYSNGNSKTSNRKGTATAHYDTMTNQDLINMGETIKKISNDQCALLMWVTSPHLITALNLMKEWGFEYKTVGFVLVKLNKKTPHHIEEQVNKHVSNNYFGIDSDKWNMANDIFDKIKFWGMGFYTRSNTEFCLIGLKPKSRAKDLVKNRGVHQLIFQAIEPHSKKPDKAYLKINKLFGEVEKIELFARKDVKGFDCWGNEC